MSTLRILPETPAEVVVHDQLASCPYLAGKVARMPLRLPIRSLSHDELDARLAAGDRRQGYFLYRTVCPRCRACEPIRLDVHRFRPRRTQRRVFLRGERAFRVEVGPPQVDDRRVGLYNLHRSERGLDDGSESIDREGYRAFLVHTCCDTIEIRYLVEDRLVGVAITDRGANAMSAVYCFYDPEYERLSPGVYSIMKQLDLCRSWGLRHLYLGLYIRDCRAMSYKAGYRPHERLLGNSWRTIGAPGSPRPA